MNDEQLMFDFAGTPEVTATYIKTLPGAEKGGVKKAFKFENHSVPTSGFSGFDDVDSTEYFIASRVFVQSDGRYETLIFPCDQDGNITCFLELWGVRGRKPIEDVVSSFVSYINKENRILDNKHD